MKRYTQLLLVAGLLASGAVAGTNAAVAAPAGYFRQTTATVPLPTTGGAVALVEAATVTVGNWAIWGKAGIVNFNTHDVGRCFLFVNGKRVDSSASELGGGDGFPLTAVLSTQYAFAATANTVVQLACSHDADGAGQYVDASASLLIVRMPAGLIR